MPRGNYGLDYVGIEVETINTHSNELARWIDQHFWRFESDASIQSDGRILYNGMIVNSSPNGIPLSCSAGVLGTELVLNPPINLENTDSLLPILQQLTEGLMASGEPEKTTRAGVHIHISAPTNLRLLKAYTKLGVHTEDLFYYLGGQGYTFRGTVINNNAYCRPITKFGPPVVGCGNKYAQVMDVDDLLSSRSTQEFWNRYGNTNPSGELPRYHPARYTWLNLYSLLYHGSLEFRVFNTTLNPYFIFAEVLLCKAFVELCMSSAFSKEVYLETLDPNSIYDNRSKNDILKTFVSLADKMGLNPKTTNILGDIITMTPNIRFENKYMMTHLRNLGAYQFSSVNGIKYINPSEITRANVVDIHQLRGER